MLTQIVSCVWQPQYKDSARYLVKHRQLQGKALSLLRNAITKAIADAAFNLERDISAGMGAAPTDQQLDDALYIRFRTDCAAVPALASQLVVRANRKVYGLCGFTARQWLTLVLQIAVDAGRVLQCVLGCALAGLVQHCAQLGTSTHPRSDRWHGMSSIASSTRLLNQSFVFACRPVRCAPTCCSCTRPRPSCFMQCFMASCPVACSCH